MINGQRDNEYPVLYGDFLGEELLLCDVQLRDLMTYNYIRSVASMFTKVLYQAFYEQTSVRFHSSVICVKI